MPSTIIKMAASEMAMAIHDLKGRFSVSSSLCAGAVSYTHLTLPTN
jgi:hypothetical protein